jgi:hypothetical protein
MSKSHRNRKMLAIRSGVEHVFRVIKQQFGYTKVRYKGLAKNAAQVFPLIGLSNLYLARRAMLTDQRFLSTVHNLYPGVIGTEAMPFWVCNDPTCHPTAGKSRCIYRKYVLSFCTGFAQ